MEIESTIKKKDEEKYDEENNLNKPINLKELIYDSFKYYDSNMEKFENLFGNLHFNFIYNELDYEHDKIVFINNKNENVCESRYEIIGYFYPQKKLWVWAWSTISGKKNALNVSRQLWIYGTKLDNQNIFLKTLLTNSRFTVTNNKHLDVHLAISAYLTKTLFLAKIYTRYGSKRDELTRHATSFNYKYDNNNNNYRITYMKLIDHENIFNYKQKKNEK
jgi:hypothetical protein